MNTRIYWNTIENLRMKMWIEANMPPNATAIAKVDAAQQACLGADRQRTIVSHSIALRALERMQAASTSGVPAQAAAMPVFMAVPATTVIDMTPAELAKFGAFLPKGTTVKLV